MSIRVVIADDERIARERLQTLLAEEPDIDIVGVCENGRDASAHLRRAAPDVAFLDIRMPEISGLLVAEGFREMRPPLIVFVTAYDAHAAEAFRLRAFDYIVKPYSRRRFQEVLRHIRGHIRIQRHADMSLRLLSVVEELRVARPDPAKLLVRVGDRIRVIDPAEIRWIEAARSCVRLHLAGESVSFRAQMGEITRRFRGLFIRVHRRAAVRVELIRELRQGAGSPPSVVMADGTTLRIGRRYRADLETILRSPSEPRPSPPQRR